MAVVWPRSVAPTGGTTDKMESRVWSFSASNRPARTHRYRTVKITSVFWYIISKSAHRYGVI